MEEKILYRINDRSAYRDEKEKYVRLSETNIKFLEWLDNYGYLGEDIEFKSVNDLPKIAEF